MKKKIISLISMCLVLGLVAVSVKYFRGGSGAGTTNNYKQDLEKQEVTGNKYQEEEPDETSKEFARQLEKAMKKVYQTETGDFGEFVKEKQKESPLKIDSEKVVSIGKEVYSGVLSYKVNAWEITKDNQGYEIPKGMTSLEERYGVMQYKKGTITNGYSFIIVDMTAKNLLKEEVTEYVWGNLRLKQLGKEEIDIWGSGEIIYFGESVPREYTKNYSVETIPGKEEKRITLIFLQKDQLLEEGQLYIEINPTGTTPINSSYRWIVLK